MVAILDKILPGFDASSRRFLLAVKRDCFNGRRLGRYREKPEWANLLQVSAELAPEIVRLEEQLLENDRAFNKLFEDEFARERRHTLSLVEDRRFLRGVAQGRPGLVQQIRARAPSLAASGFLKTPEKWELSLLRFVTRAAAKLSANSTLTVYALGSIRPTPSPAGFRFAASPQRETSRVRVNRPELEQLQALLMRLPAVRGRALVAWNDSVEETAPGQYRFLRDGHWSLDPGAQELHFVQPARATVKISNPLLGMARDALREGPLRYDILLALDPQNRSGLDQLIGFGLLILLPPWPIHEAWLERRIARFLRELPGEPALSAAADALEELLAREEGFASAPQPESAVTGLEEAFSHLLDTVAHLAGHEGSLTLRAHFFEDVLEEPAVDSGDDRGSFRISSSIVQEILLSARLASRFAGLFSHRHDVLHTLAAWWREHEPGRREAPFTEIARGFTPLWKQFFHFHKTAYDDALNTFNPLHTDSVDVLRETRETLLARSRELLSTSPAKDFLATGQLAELVETLPRRYAPLQGPCVFVQPADAEGSTWVLNRLHEGTGQYLSRVIPLLEEPRQRRFLDHLIARSVVEVEGEEADFLEVKYPWSHLARAHPPQAAKVLDLRGLHLDLPRERKVGLDDLTIQADLDSETFRLIDREGRRVLPVNLSTLSGTGLPNLLRFLLLFGPGETRVVFPLTHYEGDEDCRTFNRLTCGRLVLSRRRFRIDVARLREDLGTLTGARAYVAIQDWRRRLGLPREGFYRELSYQGILKPQYVDFGSPSLCRLFAASLQKMTDRHLTFEEALPSPADFPFDAAMDRRGFELLIDSLAIRDLGGNPSAGAPDQDRENRSLRKEEAYGRE
jgi:hypothetical protein